MLVRGREYFMPYTEFPWFKNAPVESVFKVELHHRDHLHWPQLDIDLSVDSLADTESYPLVYR